MDNAPSDFQAKYQKLASEYSKLRAQAAVLRRAVLDEQSRSNILRETIRNKEGSLRRSEQEADSLKFRNEQLIRRVASLQDDLENTTTKPSSSKKDKKSNDRNSLLDQELKKKIEQIAQLATQNSDKDHEINFLTQRVESLENRLSQQHIESVELESNLRTELRAYRAKCSELEGTSGSSEAGSLLGSEDAVSVTGINSVRKPSPSPVKDMSIMTTKESSAKLAELEKEVQHWRTEYELLKMLGNVKEVNANGDKAETFTHEVSDCDTILKTSLLGSLTLPINLGEESRVREETVRSYFGGRLKLLAEAKGLEEAKVHSLEAEINALETRLQMSEEEVRSGETKLKEVQINLNRLEEELATTRLNYDQQLRVMSDYVADLHDQLGAPT